MTTKKQKGRKKNRKPTGDVWARTAVRAASHAHDDGVVAEPVFFTDLLDFVDQEGQVLDRRRCQYEESICR